MIKSNGSVSKVKDAINELLYKPVEVTFLPGRNKSIKYEGELSAVYPALFTVTPFDKNFRGKTSYSYSEYLCGKVKIALKKDVKGAKTI